MGCKLCLVQKPEEQYKVMLQVNGKELSRLSQEQTLEALRCSKEPLVIQVLRHSPRARGGGEGAALPGDPATLVDSGTQTDITFEHLLALGRRRPPSPPAMTLETFGIPELPPFGHDYYDPVEFMEEAPPETERAEELEYEEVELYKSSHRDKLGLMVCYRTDDEDDVGIYVGEVNPDSIAAKDGRIREGDRIIQINGVQVQDREEAVAILTQEQQTNISLLLARPETELSRRWKDSDREDFLDDFGSDHEGETRPRATPGQQPAVAPDPPSASQELDSGVGRTDESTRNEESSEHDLLGDEPPSSAGTPAPQRRPAPLQARDFHFSMDSLPLAGGELPAPPEVPGLTDAEFERYRELLELRGHLATGPGPLRTGLEPSRTRAALLEEELRHLQFKCRNILRAQKMQRLRERCLKAWLLEDGGGPAPAGEGHPPAPLADITEVPERSEKDSTSAYNTGESCRSTPPLGSPSLRPCRAGPDANLPGPPPKPGRLRRPREGSPGLARRARDESPAPGGLAGGARAEWKGKARGEGTRRPGRDRLLKARALKIREERSGMTTDDDAVSEMKMGRYWSKGERKQQLLRAREQRRRRELMLQSRLDWQREAGEGRAGGAPGAPGELSILALSHRKSLKKRSRRILDNWITIQEMLAHGARSADGRRVYNPLLSVTTV
ncbi:LOW QUALITY PROTEIN: PDZ domain-containing protein 4 [Dermochelys coriacea]|uniref:LOW QUALITY PROTEIN: PDZ domain-containing protein 4 n=1 Tax=Dermochelys coriacea TaxID=27794 RepID=UPI0018E73A3B|nr:LOW QUALITY PROTEIN: PDZ domain-containing protein 4 [Dermochelys coriacea]